MHYLKFEKFCLGTLNKHVTDCSFTSVYIYGGKENKGLSRVNRTVLGKSKPESAAEAKAPGTRHQTRNIRTTTTACIAILKHCYGNIPRYLYVIEI